MKTTSLIVSGICIFFLGMVSADTMYNTDNTNNLGQEQPAAKSSETPQTKMQKNPKERSEFSAFEIAPMQKQALDPLLFEEDLPEEWYSVH